MSRRPRVLMVDNDADDFLRYRLLLSRAAAASGFDVHVALPRGSATSDLRAEPLEVHAVPMDRFCTSPTTELRSVVGLLRLYRALAPDVVHHFTLKPALYGGIAGRLLGTSRVATITGLGYLFSSSARRARLLRRAAAVGLRYGFGGNAAIATVQHDGDREALVRDGIVPPARVRVLRGGSGVDLRRFTPQPAPTGDIVVLMASRMLGQKGVREYAAAAAAVRARCTGVRFVLAGDPEPGHPDTVPVEELARWDAMRTLEWIRRQADMPAVLAASHIVCLPTTYGEGVPRILIEAAAAGRPVVSTDLPGCREVVRHEENGLLVPAGDHDALVAALCRLVASEKLRDVLGRRGRELATTHFADDRFVASSLLLYAELLGRTEGPATPAVA